MNKGCPNCKHYKIGRLNVFKPDEPSTCLLNYTEKFNTWWLNNGHKQPTDKLDDMDCHEETVLGTMLDKTSNILDKLINQTNNS